MLLNYGRGMGYLHRQLGEYVTISSDHFRVLAQRTGKPCMSGDMEAITQVNIDKNLLERVLVLFLSKAQSLPVKPCGNTHTFVGVLKRD